MALLFTTIVRRRHSAFEVSVGPQAITEAQTPGHLATALRSVEAEDPDLSLQLYPATAQRRCRAGLKDDPPRKS
jgi:hypothetical protein